MKLGVTLLTGCPRKTPLGASSNAWNIWAITWPCSTTPLTQHLHNGYFHVSIKRVVTLFAHPLPRMHYNTLSSGIVECW